MNLVPATRGPIRFENLFGGSFFQIVAEPSRGIFKSRDARLYRRARDHEGFYSEEVDAETGKPTGKAVVLMPEDVVRPLKRGK